MRRIVMVSLAWLAAAAWAGEAAKPASKDKEAAKAKPKAKGKEPQKFEQLDVWADRIVYHGDSGRFTFTGHVTVIRADLRVDCGEMEGTVDPKTRGLTEVSAVGGVRMVSGGVWRPDPRGGPPALQPAADAWRATSGRADYDLKSGKLTLSGRYNGARPRLARAEGYAEADKIEFLPEKGEYVLLGNPVIHGEIPSGPVREPPKPEPKTPEAPKPTTATHP